MQRGVKERYDTFIANMVLNGMNGALAIRQTPGYSDKYARTQARRLSTKLYIKEGLARKQAEIAEKFNVTVENVVSSFVDVAKRAKIKQDLANENRALENIGKHLGIYQKDNEQKGQTIFDILAIVGVKGIDGRTKAVEAITGDR
jgi:phage terminase small subunit